MNKLSEKGTPYWWLNDESLAILNRGYLLNGETVEGAVKRVSKACSNRLNMPEMEELFEEAIAKGWISLSTPIWCNMGTERGLPIACFNVSIPDNIEGITNKLGEVMMQTKVGGGTSGYFGNLRGRGASVTNNGKSSGAVSFMELFDKVMTVVTQGCFTEKTEVLTEGNGFVSIKDIVKSKKYKLPNIRYIANAHKAHNSPIQYRIGEEPLDYFEYEYDDMMYKLQLFNNKELKSVVNVTKNHNILIFRNDERDGLFIEAEELYDNLDKYKEYYIVCEESPNKITKCSVSDIEFIKYKYKGTVYCVEVRHNILLAREGDYSPIFIGNSTRRGSFAAYLDIDHPDIKEFLTIKDIGHPIQNLFYGVCVPDYWLEEMIAGDEEKREIWSKVLESRQHKGLPYISFTDNINRNKPEIFKKLNKKINGSNLCNEIALYSNEDESFVCCLSSLNLALYDEWKDTEVVKIVTYLLDAVIEEFIEKTKDSKHLEQSHNFAKNTRAIGIGTMGLHSYYQKIGRPFGHPLNIGLNKQIFSKIQKESYEASEELGKLFGYAPIYDNVKDENGNYAISEKPRRNVTTMAIAPTTSSSAILGQVSPGIEPFSSNYYKVNLAKGNFIRKNKQLEKLLEEKGCNTEEVWRDIMIKQGSVQHLDCLTPEEKEIFKTFKEISQADIIQQAAVRQEFIDQSQSLNINIPPDVPPKEVNKLILDGWKQGVKGFYYQRSQSVTKELLSNIVTCSSCES